MIARQTSEWSQNELQRRLNKMSSNCKSWSQGEAPKSWSQGKSSKNPISRRSSKRRSQQSTASSLSLLVMPQHIGINKMLSNPFGKSEILRKSAVKQFVILWFVRLANLSETDFQKLFCQQIYQLSNFSFTNEYWCDAVIHLFLLQYLIS